MKPPATFIELHKAQNRVLRAVEKLAAADAQKVFDAVAFLKKAAETEEEPRS